MTCRHKDGDPACTTRNPAAMKEHARAMSARWDPPTTPDSENYDIVHAESRGRYLILEVQYPSCDKCAYEGRKLMVFIDIDVHAALQWKCIDPHFRDPAVAVDSRSAPSPVARFPATLAGWTDALAYAQGGAHSSLPVEDPRE